MRLHRRLVIALVSAIGVSSCDGGLTAVCTSELRVSLGPQDTVLTVGATIIPRVALSSCGGRENLPERIALTSANPSVIEVGVNPPRLSALSAGIVYVEVVDSTYGHVGTMRLAVAAAP